MAQWVKDPGGVFAVALVAAVVQFQSLAQELPHAAGTGKKRKKKKERKKKKRGKRILKRDENQSGKRQLKINTMKSH